MTAVTLKRSKEIQGASEYHTMDRECDLNHGHPHTSTHSTVMKDIIICHFSMSDRLCVYNTCISTTNIPWLSWVSRTYTPQTNSPHLILPASERKSEYKQEIIDHHIITPVDTTGLHTHTVVS
jgi:hypothetical protein